jgi:regulator of replication initiation timing
MPISIRDLMGPVDEPALYFMQETAALRAENKRLRAALADVLALLADGDAEAADADRVADNVRRALGASS